MTVNLNRSEEVSRVDEYKFYSPMTLFGFRFTSSDFWVDGSSLHSRFFSFFFGYRRPSSRSSLHSVSGRDTFYLTFHNSSRVCDPGLDKVSFQGFSYFSFSTSYCYSAFSEGSGFHSGMVTGERTGTSSTNTLRNERPSCRGREKVLMNHM